MSEPVPSLAQKQPAKRRRPSGLVQLLAVFRKEVNQTVRDRRVMFLLIVAPLIQTIVFGYAVDFDVDHVPTLVVDFDQSPESRRHVRRLLADGTLERTAEATSLPEVERALDVGDVAAAIVLPKGLQRDSLAGRAAEVQVILDGTDPNRSGVAASVVSRYFAESAPQRAWAPTAAQGQMPQSGQPAPELARAGAQGTRPPNGISLVPRVAFNPSLRTAPYILPGVLGMLLLIVTTVVTAMGMSRERETGTLEQVLVTPIRPLYLLIGKMAPFLIIGMLDVGLVLAAGVWLFDVPLRGDLGVLVVATVLYLLSTLGMGLFISTVSSTQQQSFLGGFLFAMPAILLSGVLTPIRAMPDWLAMVTYLNPVRYYAEAVRAVLMKGAGYGDLHVQLGALAAFGVVIVLLSTLRFRKRLR